MEAGVDLAPVLARVPRHHGADHQVVVRAPPGRLAHIESDPPGGSEHGAARAEDGELGPPEPGHGGGANVDHATGQHSRAVERGRDVDLGGDN